MSVYSFGEWNLNENLGQKKKGKISPEKQLLQTINNLMPNKQPIVSTEVARRFKFLDFEEKEKGAKSIEEIKKLKDVNYFLNSFKYLDSLKILINPEMARQGLDFQNQIPNYAYDYNNLPDLIRLPVHLTKYIVRFFMAAGLSKPGAVALAANFWKESRFNPHQDQIGGGPGYGLAQWDRKDRWGRFVNSFLPAFRSSDPAFSSASKHDLDAQLSYTIYEMKTFYNDVYLELLKPYRLEQKVILIMQKYEVCRDRNKPEEQQERFDISKNIAVINSLDYWVDIIEKSIFVLKDLDLKRFY